jgi:hypothetical protein
MFFDATHSSSIKFYLKACAMTNSPAFSQPSPRYFSKCWTRVLAAIGIGGLATGAALIASTPPPNALMFVGSPLLKLAALPALRLPVSLPTGTLIEPSQGGGRSQLLVKNGNSEDAVFKLVDRASGQTLRFVYVQANQEVTLKDLGNCDCDLRFAKGIDWDAEQKQFRRKLGLMAFSDPIKFATWREGNMEYWSVVEVTLHPTEGGTAQTKAIDPEKF